MLHDKDLSPQTQDALAKVGTDAVAYMREMTFEEVMNAFPQTPELEQGETYWALFSADGAPLMLASDRVDVASSAFYSNLKAVLPN